MLFHHEEHEEDILTTEDEKARRKPSFPVARSKFPFRACLGPPTTPHSPLALQTWPQSRRIHSPRRGYSFNTDLTDIIYVVSIEGIPEFRALSEFTEHYHAERNHQGLGNNIIIPGEEVGQTDGDVQRRERLGGILSYYFRETA